MNVVLRTCGSQIAHFAKPDQVFECATARAMYSMVNSATRLVSSPNQTLPEIVCDVGMVSKTVTVAEIIISEVVAKWITKADCEDVGCSSKRYRSRFHRGWMSFATSAAFSKEMTWGNVESPRGDDALLPPCRGVDDPVCARGMESAIGSRIREVGGAHASRW